MFSKKELKLAYGLAICLLVVGVVSYAAFPLKTPEEPIRIMYTATAGRVLFDHQTHGSETGFGVACVDCHHHAMESDEERPRSCADCHTPPPADQKINSACLDCHEADEIEDTEVPNTGDAYHGQCIVCHKDFGAGPVECAQCHVM